MAGLTKVANGERPVITEEREEIMSEPNKPTTVPSVDDIVMRRAGWRFFECDDCGQ